MARCPNGTTLITCRSSLMKDKTIAQISILREILFRLVNLGKSQVLLISPAGPAQS